MKRRNSILKEVTKHNITKPETTRRVSFSLFKKVHVFEDLPHNRNEPPNNTLEGLSDDDKSFSRIQTKSKLDNETGPKKSNDSRKNKMFTNENDTQQEDNSIGFTKDIREDSSIEDLNCSRMPIREEINQTMASKNNKRISILNYTVYDNNTSAVNNNPVATKKQKLQPNLSKEQINTEYFGDNSSRNFFTSLDIAGNDYETMNEDEFSLIVTDVSENSSQNDLHGGFREKLNVDNKFRINKTAYVISSPIIKKTEIKSKPQKLFGVGSEDEFFNISDEAEMSHEDGKGDYSANKSIFMISPVIYSENGNFVRNADNQDNINIISGNEKINESDLLFPIVNSNRSSTNERATVVNEVSFSHSDLVNDAGKSEHINMSFSRSNEEVNESDSDLLFPTVNSKKRSAEDSAIDRSKINFSNSNMIDNTGVSDHINMSFIKINEDKTYLAENSIVGTIDKSNDFNTSIDMSTVDSTNEIEFNSTDDLNRNVNPEDFLDLSVVSNSGGIIMDNESGDNDSDSMKGNLDNRGENTVRRKSVVIPDDDMKSCSRTVVNEVTFSHSDLIDNTGMYDHINISFFQSYEELNESTSDIFPTVNSKQRSTEDGATVGSKINLSHSDLIDDVGMSDHRNMSFSQSNEEVKEFDSDFLFSTVNSKERLTVDGAIVESEINFSNSNLIDNTGMSDYINTSFIKINEDKTYLTENFIVGTIDKSNDFNTSIDMSTVDSTNEIEFNSTDDLNRNVNPEDFLDLSVVSNSVEIIMDNDSDSMKGNLDNRGEKTVKRKSVVMPDDNEKSAKLPKCGSSYSEGYNVPLYKRNDNSSDKLEKNDVAENISLLNLESAKSLTFDYEDDRNNASLSAVCFDNNGTSGDISITDQGMGSYSLKRALVDEMSDPVMAIIDNSLLDMAKDINFDETIDFDNISENRGRSDETRFLDDNESMKRYKDDINDSRISNEHSRQESQEFVLDISNNNGQCYGTSVFPNDFDISREIPRNNASDGNIISSFSILTDSIAVLDLSKSNDNEAMKSSIKYQDDSVSDIDLNRNANPDDFSDYETPTKVKSVKFSVTPLTRTQKHDEGRPLSRHTDISSWKESKNLYQARPSCVVVASRTQPAKLPIGPPLFSNNDGFLQISLKDFNIAANVNDERNLSMLLSRRNTSSFKLEPRRNNPEDVSLSEPLRSLYKKHIVDHLMELLKHYINMGGTILSDAKDAIRRIQMNLQMFSSLCPVCKEKRACVHQTMAASFIQSILDSFRSRLTVTKASFHKAYSAVCRKGLLRIKANMTTIKKSMASVNKCIEIKKQPRIKIRDPKIEKYLEAVDKVKKLNDLTDRIRTQWPEYISRKAREDLFLMKMIDRKVNPLMECDEGDNRIEYLLMGSRVTIKVKTRDINGLTCLESAQVSAHTALFPFHKMFENYLRDHIDQYLINQPLVCVKEMLLHWQTPLLLLLGDTRMLRKKRYLNLRWNEQTPFVLEARVGKIDCDIKFRITIDLNPIETYQSRDLNYKLIVDVDNVYVDKIKSHLDNSKDGVRKLSGTIGGLLCDLRNIYMIDSDDEDDEEEVPVPETEVGN